MEIHSASKLEEVIGCRFPIDYRKFLEGNDETLLEDTLVFCEPRTGSIDELFTISKIVKNMESNGLGIPEKGLICIGRNFFGGYLYIKISENDYGEVHYLENYCFKEVFPSFTSFVDQTVKENA